MNPSDQPLPSQFPNRETLEDRGFVVESGFPGMGDRKYIAVTPEVMNLLCETVRHLYDMETVYMRGSAVCYRAEVQYVRKDLEALLNAVENAE